MQEINEKSDEQGKVSEDKTAFRSLSKNPIFIEDDLEATLYNPSRVDIKKYADSDIFILRIGGPYYDAKVKIGLSKEQLEQLGQIITEALTWADIPKNTKVI